MTFFQKLFRFNVQSYLKSTKIFYSLQITKKTTPNIIPVTLMNNFTKNPWIYHQQTDIGIPFKKTTINLPQSILEILPKLDRKPIEIPELYDPLTENNKIEKHAVKLIVIRRHKMRKHKLRKLRKRMKFEWAKRRQRRELQKEKLFQGSLITQIKEADKFSAEEFVAEKLRKAAEVPIPKLWKGKRLPEFIIREKLGLPPK